MVETVNTPVRKTRREIAAEATQALIVETADRLFMERGYVATTIESIAEEAGVAVQTIYNSVGSKADVLSRVLDRTASGPEAPTPVPDFMRDRTDRARDADEVVALLADWFAEVQPRVAPLWDVIAAASAVDPDVAQLRRERDARRLRNYELAARLLAAKRGASPTLSVHEAAAMIWTLGHPSTYRFLVTEQGWSVARYRRWLRRGLRSQLVGA
ncbi:MAG TPA: helix-turn-helix domain-containing protein [Actinomycetota bacterium]